LVSGFGSAESAAWPCTPKRRQLKFRSLRRRRAPDPDRFGCRQTGVDQGERCFQLLRVQRIAPRTPAVRDSRGATVAGALGNKSSFKVGDRAEHMENELTGGGRRINVFFDRNPSDATGLS
jgi:hypothetical protein